jgi:hypothetical protein
MEVLSAHLDITKKNCFYQEVKRISLHDKEKTEQC